MTLKADANELEVANRMLEALKPVFENGETSGMNTACFRQGVGNLAVSLQASAVPGDKPIVDPDRDNRPGEVLVLTEESGPGDATDALSSAVKPVYWEAYEAGVDSATFAEGAQLVSLTLESAAISPVDNLTEAIFGEGKAERRELLAGLMRENREAAEIHASHQDADPGFALDGVEL